MMCQMHLAEKDRFSAAVCKAFNMDRNCKDHFEMAYDDFAEVLSDPSTQTFLGGLDLNVDDAWELFKLLDTDESNHIDVEEFVSGCLRLKGQAKAMDIAK